jgi:hypothetical protein
MSDIRPNLVAGGTFTWIPSILGIGSFLLVYSASITVLYPTRNLMVIVSFVLFAIFLLRSIYYLFQARYVRALSYVVPHITLILIMVSLAMVESLVGLNIPDTIRMSLFSRTACIQSAVDLGHGTAFGVCVWHNDDLSVTANLIIFDSSDEIALPAERRSPEWVRIASRRSLVGSLDFKSRRMIDHFYDVDFFER